MEGIIGLAVGLITLFSTCVECFEYFEAARDFPVHYEQLLTMLELEKIRLLAWGDAVGILEPDNEERVSQLYGIPIIEQILLRIKTLLLDANQLQQEYGLMRQPTMGASVDLPGTQSIRDTSIQPLASVRKRNILSLHSTFWAKYNSKPRPGLVARAVWAIRDKTKFESLLGKLRGFIDGLNDLKDVLKPEIVQRQNRAIGRDIASIPSSSLPDLENLRIVEASCSGIYPDWEEAARSSIAASELATRDGLNIQEWNLRVGNSGGIKGNHDDDASEDEPKVAVAKFLQEYRPLYLMVTESCLKTYISESCEGHNYRGSPKDLPTHSFDRHDSKWTVAWEISRVVEPHVTRYREDAELYIDLDGTGSGTPRKMATVYIYCGPCPCLIQTAHKICSSTKKSGHLEFVIRVDPRLSVNCCPSLTTGINRLKSLRASSHHSVRDSGAMFWPYLDYGWIDQIVFSAEAEEQHVLCQADTVKSQRSLANEYYPGVRMDVTLILGTASYLKSMMDSLDCGFTAKVPTVGEIWQVYAPDTNGPWTRKPWKQYTLSREAYNQAKQRQHFSRLAPTQMDSGANTTPSLQSFSRAASRLVSPPSSVASKRQRSPEDAGRQVKRSSIAGTERDDRSSYSKTRSARNVALDT